MTAERSDKNFGPALRDLMEQRDKSFRRLAIDTGRYRESGKPYSIAYLHRLASGDFEPIVENIEVIARALDVDPDYFREYREHRAAEEAKRMMREVGLDRVLAKLSELERKEPS